MQHFSNPVTATNDIIIIWAVLWFEEEEYAFLLLFVDHTFVWQSMERDYLNKLEFVQVVSEEKLFNNTTVIYMYTAHGQGKITLAE